MGDKTQLLALLLALKFRKPIPILAGIFIATVLNHALAAWVGALASSFVAPEVLKWSMVAVFVFFAIWILVPDKEGEIKESSSTSAFVTTVISFFLAEMGDKTQLATVALGAQYGAQYSAAVVFGTTIGMMLANAPVVIFGERFLKVIPLKWVRIVSSVLFLIFAIVIALKG